jgi:hypothetical protein
MCLASSLNNVLTNLIQTLNNLNINSTRLSSSSPSASSNSNEAASNPAFKSFADATGSASASTTAVRMLEAINEQNKASKVANEQLISNSSHSSKLSSSPVVISQVPQSTQVNDASNEIIYEQFYNGYCKFRLAFYLFYRISLNFISALMTTFMLYFVEWFLTNNFFHF